MFDKGQVRLEIPDEHDVQPLGSYARGPNGWVVLDRNGKANEFTFTANAFGIRSKALGDGQQRFLYRRSFSWIPKTITWIKLHWL